MNDDTTELRGNKAIEDAAIAWVVELERAAGRDARDARYRGAPGDVESGDRIIEVKAFGEGGRGLGLWLETRQVDEARRNLNFYVYVAENVRQGDPTTFTLKVLGWGRLRRLLERAKERRYYEVRGISSRHGTRRDGWHGCMKEMRSR